MMCCVAFTTYRCSFEAILREQTCFSHSSCARLLFQEVFWREDRTVLRLARLVHGDAVSCSSSWPAGISVRAFHSGALPGQVKTPPLCSDKHVCPAILYSERLQKKTHYFLQTAASFHESSCAEQTKR